MNLLAGIFAMATVGAWVATVAHYVMLFGHRRPGVTVARLVFSGLASFDPDNFDEAGQRVQRRMVACAAAFGAFAVAGMIVAMIASG